MIRRRAIKSKRLIPWFAVVACSWGVMTCQGAPFVPGYDRFAHRGAWDEQPLGELLLTELSCAACHTESIESEARWAPKRGPRLNTVARRIRASWLNRFLRAPQHVKPGTTMPSLMADRTQPEQDRIVAELLAFLSTQRDDYPQLQADGAHPLPHEFWLQGDPKTGRSLYHRIGCVACHEPDDQTDESSVDRSTLETLAEQLEPEELAELGLQDAVHPVQSVPLGDLNAKYTRRGLTFFLLDPHAIRPSGRMPDLALSPLEAADVAAYLQSIRKENVSPLAPEQDLLIHQNTNAKTVAAGRHWFEQLRCVNCHEVQAEVVEQPAAAFETMAHHSEQGCLASTARPSIDHSLNDAQRSALRASLASVVAREKLVAKEPAEEVRLQMARLNCFGCHRRERQGGVGIRRRRHFTTIGEVDLGDEGRFPPALDRTGAKLRTEWIHQVLEGRGAVRPYLNIRMPRFPKTQVASLVRHWEEADAVSRAVPTSLPIAAQVDGEAEGMQATRLDAGRQLLDTGCVQCHPFRGERVPGAVGIDLQQIDRRLRPDWFLRFLRDPESQKAGTRMPSFFPQGISQRPDLLGGDVDQQLAAIWQYLNATDAPLPAKILQARAASFEVTPRERPIVLRTFMEQAGTHAIVVGFPSGVHFAMDAQTPRLATLWRGRFLDAYGTWFVRFAPPATPLGHDIQHLATAESFRLSIPAKITFAGYRLDRDGVPTFLYRGDEGLIEDRIEPGENGSLRRSLQWQVRVSGAKVDADSAPKPTDVWCRVHSGMQLERVNKQTMRNENGLQIEVHVGAVDRGRVGSVGERRDWWLPINESASRIELRYTW